MKTNKSKWSQMYEVSVESQGENHPWIAHLILAHTHQFSLLKDQRYSTLVVSQSHIDCVSPFADCISVESQGERHPWIAHVRGVAALGSAHYVHH